MLTLSILRELHTKLVYFVLAKNQAGVKLYIFVELTIDFAVEVENSREWVIIRYKNLYGLKYAGLECF